MSGRGLLVTARQLEVLQAAAEGRLFRDNENQFSTWRVEGGRVATVSAWCLVDRDLIRTGAEPDGRGRFKALVTTEGYAVIAELASRAPGPHAPEVTA